MFINQSGEKYFYTESKSVASAGQSIRVWTGLRTVQDFNDGLDYNATFKLKFGAYTGGNSPIAQRILIGNGSLNPFPGGLPGDCTYTTLTPGKVLFEWGTVDDGTGVVPVANYSLYIDGTNNNVSLYNETDFLNSTIVTDQDVWKITFEHFYQGTNTGTNHHTMELYNFTISSTSVDTRVNLVSPEDYTVNALLTPYFVANISMGQTTQNVSNATLYVMNSTDIINTTFVTLNNNLTSDIANVSVELNYTNYTWTYYGCGINNVETRCVWAGSNYSLEIYDSVNPLVTITNPTGTLGDRSFDIDIVVTESGVLSYCYYNITRGGTIEIANTQIENCTNTNTTVSVDADFVINVFVNDSNNNINITSQSFTVDTTPVIGSGGSGGGGTTVIVGDDDKTWSMQSDQNTGSYVFKMSSGSSRTRNIRFENLGTETINLKLKCTESDESLGDICESITFEKTEVELPVGLDISTRISFDIELPEDFVNGDYLANIIATDQFNRQGLLTLEVDVGESSFLIDTINKLSDSKTIGNTNVPYILFFAIGGFVSFGVSFLFLRKVESIGMFLSVIIAVVGAFFTVAIL